MRPAELSNHDFLKLETAFTSIDDLSRPALTSESSTFVYWSASSTLNRECAKCENMHGTETAVEVPQAEA